MPYEYVQAQKYAALRKPYLINDMMAQSHLLNRKMVYQTLQARPSLSLHSKNKHVLMLGNQVYSLRRPLQIGMV